MNLDLWKAALCGVALVAACAGTPAADDADGDPDPGGDPTPPTADTGIVADADGDGDPAATDCDDSDPTVHVGASETCDGRDEDCDGATDEGAIDVGPVFTDADGDGFGDPATERAACPAAAEVTQGGDCDDSEPDVHPGASERCNQRDDDCDAATPEIAERGGVGMPSIAAALAGAVDGDVVTVCAGRHVEHDLAVHVDVTVTGATADPADTVIDADLAGPAFTVDGGALTLAALSLVRGVGAADGGGERVGGAVCAALGAGGPVVAEDVVFDGNSAAVGGAIAGPDVTLDACVLTANHATVSGGAVDVRGLQPGDLGALTVTATTFDGNTSDNEGGAVSLRGDAAFVDATVSANAGYAVGGGLRVAAGSAALTASVVTANDAQFGGGVSAADGTAVTLDAASVLQANTALDGAGAHLEGAVTWTGGTITLNTSAYGGAGMEIDNGSGGTGPATISDAAITDNHVSDFYYFAAGGGLYVWGEAVLERLVVTGNSAVEGGGVYAVGATLDVIDTSIDGNTADDGGGLYVEESPQVTLSGGSVTANVADHGAGLYVQGVSVGHVDVVGVDFGEGAADNVRDDAALNTDFRSTPDVSYADWAAAATFTCQVRPTAACQ